MRLKKYNEFQSINENFANSNEYSNFLKEKSLDREFFTDNLMSISDIDGVTISLHKMICDKDGKFIDKYDDNNEYYIKYMVIIDYKMPTSDYKIDDFFEKVSIFDEIKLAIHEMKDRCSDKVNFNWEKVILNPSSTHRAIEIREFKFEFAIHFISEDISDILKPYYNEYKSTIGPNYEKMMNKLRAFYRTFDIDFDKYYDTNSTGDHINIGVFPPNDADLHHVADYEIKTDKFDIYHRALTDSLSDFGINPQQFRQRPYTGDPD